MIGCLLGLVACQPSLPHIDEQKEITPVIYPDYKEVTIPVNVAPLNFGRCSSRFFFPRTFHIGLVERQYFPDSIESLARIATTGKRKKPGSIGVC